MQIDKVSENIINIALCIDNSFQGYVSEIWIDDEILKKIKAAIPSKEQLPAIINETDVLINEIPDKRRKQYLRDILKAEEYFYKNFENREFKYAEFSSSVFGFQINRITEKEITQIQDEIKELEKKLGKTRLEVCRSQSIDKNLLLEKFKEYLTETKKLIPQYLLDYQDMGFEIEIVTNEPWSAFNHHLKPFFSKLSLNSDVSLVEADLHQLSYHEAYAGHHSELSNKDKLLLNGHGENGLVITYSPQVFISEAIAEGMYFIFNDKKDDDNVNMVRLYTRLTFALQNLATHLYFEDNLSKSDIRKTLLTFYISEKTADNIVNFSTDKLFGKYAPIYYSGRDFFVDQNNKATDKDEFVKEIFTQPTTPSILQ